MMINVCGATLLRASNLRYVYTTTEIIRAAIPQCLTLIVVIPIALLTVKKIGLKKAIEQLAAPLSMALAGVAVCISVHCLSRVTWPVQLGSIILFVRCICLLTKPKSSHIWILMHVVTLSIYISWLGSLEKWQKRISDEERELISQAVKGTDPLCLLLTQHWQIPWYLNSIPHHWIYSKIWNHIWARHYCGKEAILIKPLTGRQILIADTAATVPVRLEVGPVNGSTQPIDFIMALATGRTGPATIEVQAEASNVPGLYYLASPGRVYRSRRILSATPVKSEN